MATPDDHHHQHWHLANKLRQRETTNNYLSEGVPHNVLGVMVDGPGNPRFVAVSHRRRRAQKNTEKYFPKKSQNPFPWARDTYNIVYFQYCWAILQFCFWLIF